MAARQTRPNMSSPTLRGEPLDDPFSDHPGQAHLNDADSFSLGAPSLPHPYESATSLQNPAYDAHEDDEYIEKQPLTVGQTFYGGFYPPA